MTQSQYQSILTLLRRVEQRVEAVEDRLAFEFPQPHEMRQQLDAELDSILSPGASICVFED